MESRNWFLHQAADKIIERGGLVRVDDKGYVTYALTEDRLNKAVNDLCDKMFEEHKAEQEAYFSGPAVMSASHRRALIHCAVYSRSEIKEMIDNG
jgi:hypothetical protein